MLKKEEKTRSDQDRLERASLDQQSIALTTHPPVAPPLNSVNESFFTTNLELSDVTNINTTIQ